MFGLSFLFTTALLFAKAIALRELVSTCIARLEREVYVHLLIVGHIHPRTNLGVRTTCSCFLRSEAEEVQEPITLHGLGQLALLRPEGCRVLLTMLVLRIISTDVDATYAVGAVPADELVVGTSKQLCDCVVRTAEEGQMDLGLRFRRRDGALGSNDE